VRAPVVDTDDMSPECAVAQLPRYKDLHQECHQTKDIPLPGGGGILLQRRCGCLCHRLKACSE